MTQKILDKIPWGKITAPMLPIIIVDYFLGKFLKDIYTINVTHGLVDRFPTSKTFYIFLGANFVILSVYLGLSAWGHISQEKIYVLRAKMELDTAKE